MKMKKCLILFIVGMCLSIAYGQKELVKEIDSLPGVNLEEQTLTGKFRIAFFKDKTLNQTGWITIGRKKNEMAILKAGLKRSGLQFKDIEVRSSVDYPDYKYILFESKQSGMGKKWIALYDPIHFTFNYFDLCAVIHCDF